MEDVVQGEGEADAAQAGTEDPSRDPANLIPGL
jgi:hypothetical protein